MKTLSIMLMALSFNSFAGVKCSHLLQELRDIDNKTRSLSDEISVLEKLISNENDPVEYDKIHRELDNAVSRKLYLHRLFDYKDRLYGRACHN